VDCSYCEMKLTFYILVHMRIKLLCDSWCNFSWVTWIKYFSCHLRHEGWFALFSRKRSPLQMQN
jgi:hypothetical protein